MAIHHIAFDPAEHRPTSRRYAWSVFAILVALMVVDYVDRQVVVSMFPHLKSEWELSDGQLGALVSIVSIVVAIGTVPLSLLADRWSRVKSIFLMALIWSSATIACAFAESYAQLFVARGFVGLGEAAYGSVGAALLATLFPPRMRSTVLGAFFAAALFGSVFGVVLGGVIAQNWGWQTGFGAVGIPGLALAFVFLLIVRDYKTVALTSRSSSDKPRLGFRAIVTELLRPRTAVITCLGAGLQLVMVSTVYAWLPSFFNRVYGLPPDQAGLKTGLVVIVGGVGAMLAGVLADRTSTRNPKMRLWVPAVAAVLTTVFMVSAFGLFQPGTAQFVMILAGAAVMTATIGPVAAVVVDVTHPGLRATAAAVLSLTQNLFGLALGPLLTGVLSDAYGLTFALSVVPVFCLGSAAMLFWAARSYEHDLLSISRMEAQSAADLGAQPA